MIIPLALTDYVFVCRYAFSVSFPLRPALRRELGEQLVSTGLVGAAMGLFEEEQLWDSLIICYRLLQKLPQAQQLVQARLQVGPLQPAPSCTPLPVKQ